MARGFSLGRRPWHGQGQGPRSRIHRDLRRRRAQGRKGGQRPRESGSGVVGVEARGLGRRFLLGDLDLAYLDPSLADAAPPGLPRAKALLPDEGTEAIAPPALEELAEKAADDLVLHAVAEAVGWRPIAIS